MDRFIRLLSKIGARIGWPQRNAVDASLAPSLRTYHMTTCSGYCIESRLDTGLAIGADLVHTFIVYCPSGVIRWYNVVLDASGVAEIEGYCGHYALRDPRRFWLAVCEEALARHLEANRTLSKDGCLRICRLTDEMKGWIDTVLGLGAHPVLES